MAEAARMVEGLGFDLVDLNLGCPAKKVVKCNEARACSAISPQSARSSKPSAPPRNSLHRKIRAGWNDEEIVCVELARMAESCGLAAVALHARHPRNGL